MCEKEPVAEKRDFYLNGDLCWVFKQCGRRTGLHLNLDPYDVYARVSLAEAKPITF